MNFSKIASHFCYFGFCHIGFAYHSCIDRHSYQRIHPRAALPQYRDRPHHRWAAPPLVALQTAAAAIADTFCKTLNWNIQKLLLFRNNGITITQAYVQYSATSWSWCVGKMSTCRKAPSWREFWLLPFPLWYGRAVSGLCGYIRSIPYSPKTWPTCT